MTYPNTTQHLHKTASRACQLAMLGLFAFPASAFGNETTFGSDNEGYGGFTAEVGAGTSTPVPEWSLTANAARMTNAPTSDTGQVNSSLLKEYTLSRSDGSSATITGVLDIVSAYAADNNRFGISLFATSGNLAGIDTGLSLQYNLGSGQIQIRNGVNATVEDASNTAYLGLSGAAAIGTTFTYRADISFVGTNIEIDFTLTDQNNFSQKVSAEVVAADFTGTYFGFGTRGRIRYTIPGTNDFPIIYDAKTFTVVDTPPPPAAPFTVTIAPNTTTPGNYDFIWTSQAGKVYDLVSSTDLSTAIATWPVWDGRSALPATPPNNTLSDVTGGGNTHRFFAVIEKNAPALFSENFDAAAALPAGWTSTGPVNGTAWEVGVPSGVTSGPVTAFTQPHCAGTNIGGYFTENTNVSLVTPVIAIPAGTGATLLFRQLIDTDEDNGDLGSVRILDADNADAPIAGLEITGLKGFGSEGDGWTENSLVMPAPSVGGKNIKIQFNFVSDAGTSPGIDVFGGFYVDDVSVSLN